jgi:hypothetical protein
MMCPYLVGAQKPDGNLFTYYLFVMIAFCGVAALRTLAWLRFVYPRLSSFTLYILHSQSDKLVHEQKSYTTPSFYKTNIGRDKRKGMDLGAAPKGNISHHFTLPNLHA